MNKKLAAALTAIGVHKTLTAEQKHDITVAAYQSAPSAATSAAATAAGWQLSDILTLLSMAFITLQIIYLIWKWRRDARRERANLPPAD